MNRIGDFALIGDCHSAALVGPDGRIEWACFPRFDSPSVFGAILDDERGGAWSITASDTKASSRAYLRDTNVLVTTFETATGTVELTDCMPIERSDDGKPRRTHGHAAIMRRVRCIAGTAAVDVELAPRFEYGGFVPRFRTTSDFSAEIVGGADALYVHATRPLAALDGAIVAHWELAAGDTAWIDTVWKPSYEPKHQSTSPDAHAAEGERRLAATIAFWRTWLHRCAYDGLHRDAVLRSALALKALTYAPSGAVVAAATTSLPEELGGARNWDYRYTWIRDATLTLTAMFVTGFVEEADDFKTWLERTGAGRPEALQIMYGIGGERSLPELELTYLAGHRHSVPVRIGNGAVKQLQLDAYGQILEAAFLYARAGGNLDGMNWRFLSGLVDLVCKRWQLPDQGIWEVRDAPRHFTHSKANCWLALHRGVQLAQTLGLPCDLPHWIAERERVREFVLQQCAPAGWFQQAASHAVPDASALLVPSYGMLPTTSPLVRETIAVVRRSLERDGLLYRYLAPDGLPGGEGAFLLCSFWLVDCLTHAGNLDEAEALLTRLLGLANDVGLFSEEIEPQSGEALGNLPQAFSHMALITSCAHLTAARRGLLPGGAYDYNECALDRLLAARGAPVRGVEA
ncbi:MAG: glycoside hydrolase family 15 protein [Kofleriaceae bacterium]|nr:glycoside hydrolase family 15 protein [Kofleriaceae bacterium]